MNKVIDVSKKKKHYLVTLDTAKGKTEYLVSEELILEFRLVKGKELDQSTLLKFINAFAKDEYYQKVLHYALYKQRCTHEIVEYLERLKILPEDFAFYLHKLYKTGILDDQSYCDNYINEAFELKLYGPKKIQFELEKKHLKRELFIDKLSKISKNQIKENIERLFTKKLTSIKNQSINKSIMQIKQFIANKGYDYQDIESVIRENQDLIIDKAQEDKALINDISIAKRKYKSVTGKKNEKILANLLRKGYSYHKIKAKMGDLIDE